VFAITRAALQRPRGRAVRADLNHVLDVGDAGDEVVVERIAHVRGQVVQGALAGHQRLHHKARERQLRGQPPCALSAAT
jgi:hypothetical protein